LTFISPIRTAEAGRFPHPFSQRTIESGLTISERSRLRERTYRFVHCRLFDGLQDLNNGFDVPQIAYFSAADFAVILNRAEALGTGILGIEPWPDGEFGGCKTYEAYSDDPADPSWYRRAFSEFLNQGMTSHFSATYRVPESRLDEAGF
jgi:hypothetical protein